MPNLSPHDPSGQAPTTCPHPTPQELLKMFTILSKRFRTWGEVAIQLRSTERRPHKYRRGELYPPDSILTRILELTKEQHHEPNTSAAGRKDQGSTL